jgi:transcriptional regulator with XRE-family HTH domain
MAKIPIGQAIRAVRQIKGLSQHDVTVRLGWYKTLLVKIEKGVRPVRVDELVAIAGAIEVTPSKLLRYAIRNAAKGVA